MSNHPPEASRNPMPPLRIVVAGGGAAGMIAAWRAAGLGHAVTLLEANERLGTKILISGGGKCNITHAGPVQELLRAFPPAQARFLRPGLHGFGSEEVLELLRREGVATQARDNGRVFPLDRPGSAALVTAAFEALVRRAGVAVRLGARVAALQGARPRLEALVLAGGERLEADRFILATGGASYPRTGTRGEVLGWLAALGVPVAPWFPALAPIPLRRPRPAWEGVALRGGVLQLRAGPGGKLLAAHAGDILFTRAGVSGPAALELSRAVEAARRSGEAWLGYTLTRQGEAPLEAELLALQGGNPHLAARTWLQRWLPERLCGPALEESGLPADQRMNDLPRAGRKAILALVLAFPLGEPGPVDLERGEVSAGGVRLEAVEPRTMALKGWDNLRVCGELLDIDGPVGGYNLQAAFSTGYMAGS
jgi:predicted Rossmann fold flavoprotein